MISSNGLGRSISRLASRIRDLGDLGAQDRAVLREKLGRIQDTLSAEPKKLSEIDEEGRYRSSDPCLVCGGIVWLAPAGRPRFYCSEECKEVSKLLSRLGSYMPKIVARGAASGDEGRRALAILKGNLWRLGNETNAAGRLARASEWRDGRDRSGWQGLRPSRRSRHERRSRDTTRRDPRP